MLMTCTPDKDVFTPSPLFTDGVVLTDIVGLVVDNNNAPVENASVNIGNLNRQTDENGFFHFIGIQVDARRAMLEVSKDGYFKGGRAIIPSKDNLTNTRIQLLDKTSIATFLGADGGQVQLSNGIILEMPTDVVLDQNGVGFSDDVQIAAETIYPEKKDGLQKMPTDLKGINVSDETMLLESFGMFHFEWSDINDQTLSIVPGKKVAVRFPISNNLVANAPSSIPLWHYDIDEGIWKEDGTATFDNGSYIAQLGATGFWNCAQAHEFVSVKGVLQSGSNVPLSNMPFNISIENGGVLGFSFIDADGNLIANLPKNIGSKITVLDECDDIDYSASVGALNEDAIISNLKINNSSDFSRLGGTLLDCNNNNVHNGYAILSVNTKTYFFPISDGQLKADINGCSFTNSTLVAYDVENQKQSEPLQLEISTNVDAGEINVCF